ADDVGDACLRGIAGKLDGRGRRGEVEHAVGMGESLEWIVGDRYAEIAGASHFARVLVEERRSGALDGCDQLCTFSLGNRADQRTTHATGCADDNKTHAHD